MTETKSWAREYLDRARPRIAGRAEEKVAMKNYTTFRIGGFADVMVWPKNTDDLEAAICVAKEMGIEWDVLGAGSNLLVGDGGIEMVMINMNESFKNMDVAEQAREADEGDSVSVVFGAGLKLPFAAKQCQDEGIAGFEFASGIPGSVGGAVIMNAGSMGEQMEDVLEWVEWYVPETGMERIFSKDLKYEYRRLHKPERAIITGCSVSLNKDDPRRIRERIVKGLKWRRNNQPLSYPSAGSVFKNPSDYFAGRLIEDAGLKGKRKDDAQISELHANFIINRGRARSRDVLALIDLVREEVERQFKVSLELEIKTIGKEIS